LSTYTPVLAAVLVRKISKQTSHWHEQPPIALPLSRQCWQLGKRLDEDHPHHPG
jgi:hypothetical protein